MSQAQVFTARPTRADDAVDGPSEIVIAGRRVSPTVVFDTYWEFAAQRQAVYAARLAGESGPWTDDPILKAHRFTNCFRAADRVSQYLISQVLYAGDSDPAEVVFRALLFKMFNKVSTWDLLTAALGQLTWAEFDHAAYDTVLSRALADGQRLYSAAYVIPPPKFGAVRKHTNHLRLLNHMMSTDLPARLQTAVTMKQAFETLRAFPGMGDFLAFQFLIDLNYSEVLNFSEMDFVVAGPGARDGLRKCFGPQASGIEADLVRYMADTQDANFRRLGLDFGGLRGRPLQLIDCQNLFCEVDKYARVAHPDVAGISGRSRIKQKFTAVNQPMTAWFPPKWGINDDQPAAPSRRSSLVAV
ncbi:nucleotide kinase domain-containing protein [Kribbella sp. NPDC055071]